MDKTLIFGHKNPDTDSICSAIAYSYLKNTLGEKALPCRLGKVSKETQFILDYFKLEAPKFISTVFPQVSDLSHIEKEFIYEDDSLKNALTALTKEGFSSLPVVNRDKKLINLLHISDIASTYLEFNYNEMFEKYHSTYENLFAVTKGKVVSGICPKGDIKATLIPATEIDSAKAGDIILTTTAAYNKEKLEALKPSLVILCSKNGEEFDGETCDLTILQVEDDVFNVLKNISQSISVSSILKENDFITFKENDFIHEIKDSIKEANQSNFPVVSEDGKIYGTIRSKNLINYTRKKVILVDHNEQSQSVDGIASAQILEVIDHHKFGNFETNTPLMIRAEGVGCTSTLLYDLYCEAGVTPPKEIAGAMASAILSDTLIFKSPTCTKKDILAATKLCEIAGITPEEYGMEMLIAGTSISDKSDLEILYMDNKPFKMGGLNVSISQINTVDIKNVLRRRDDLLATMNGEAEEKGICLFILAVTDIVNSGSQIIIAGNQGSFVESAFKVKLEGSTAWLAGVVSRKKQIVPALIQATQV